MPMKRAFVIFSADFFCKVVGLIKKLDQRMKKLGFVVVIG